MSNMIDKISALSRNKKLLIILLLFIIMIVIVLIMMMGSKSNKLDNLREEYDPASQTTIVVSDYLGSAPGVIYVGFEKLYDQHSSTWVSIIKASLKLYARHKDINLERVSLVKDSHKVASEQEDKLDANGLLITTTEDSSEIKVVFNIDKMNLKVKFTEKFIGSKGQSSFSRFIEIYNESNHETFTVPEIDITNGVLVFSSNMPANFKIADIVNDTVLANDYIPKFNDKNLPPLKVGDRVNLYYACPINNSNPKDVCYVYKYDFYY